MKQKKKAPVKKTNISKPGIKKNLLPAINNLNNLFPIIGMGGSAGSFSSFEQFFTHMPNNSGMAFVIIMHLDPWHQGKVSEIFRNFTAMPVIEAEDGMNLEPDYVYMIPPNKDMGIHNRKLLLMHPSKPRGYRMPIDYFFQSLAEDQWNHSVGIIFSGMGSDGETGVRMIKEKLGMVMVQDPATAQYDSMPNSAISTNLVDYLLAPEEMPIRLIRYLQHPALNDAGTKEMNDVKDSNAIEKVLMMLRSQTGHDFSLYKKSTITRRIDRRIAFHQHTDYSKYVNYLHENPNELTILNNELLIGVTKFFRDQEAFDSLTSRLIPILNNKQEKDPVRVWVAGCSTGEEAYSIAIIIQEYLETINSKKRPRVQIFATDLSAGAIEHARQGIYLENIIADVTPARIEKYFIKSNEAYSVKKELREMIVFAQHNLIKDAPFTRLDLLSCRNLLIYLDSDLQKKLMPVFHYSLNPGGLLFLGPAETIGGFTDMFRNAEPKWKIFERKNGSSSNNKIMDFPFHISKHEPHLSVSDIDKTNKKATPYELFNRILLDNYTPPSVLINEKGDIVYVNGKTKNYLELGPGEAVMNINRLAREELKYVLSNAIHQARTKKNAVTVKDIKLNDGKTINRVTIKVTVLEEIPLKGLALVVFEDEGPVKKSGKPEKQTRNSAVEELEKELLYTKQQLFSTIAQMETSVEQLKSANEELQSTNEELQSTNEESLTTKEEMQSLNEELMTINMQYQSKAEELTQLNNDMKNLLDNTEIGTIFLDNDLDILRFTPQVNKLFNLIQSDIGRSITHIVSNIQYPLLSDDIREVIEKLKTKELEVKAKDGEWYNLRIIPYRTLDNFINGAVLTFYRITYLKVLEDKLNLIHRASALLLDAIKYPAVLLDHNRLVLITNNYFLKLIGRKEKEILNKSFMEITGKLFKNPKIEKFLKERKEGQLKLEFRHRFAGKGRITGVNLRGTKVMKDKKNGPSVILLTLKLEPASNKGKKPSQIK